MSLWSHRIPGYGRFFGLVAAAILWFLGGWPIQFAHAAAPVFETGSTAMGDGDIVTVAKPSGTVAGDLLVAVVDFEKGANVTTFTPPSGWTLIRRDNQSTYIGMATFYRIAGASEGASYVWTLNGSPKWAAGIARISGVNTGSPINASNGSVLNTGNPAAPSVNTTVNSTLVLAFYANKKNATYIPEGSTTERWDAPNVASNQPSNMMATFGVVSAGASGSKTSTASDATGDWVAQQVALAGADTVAPSAVTNLALSSPTTSSMLLTWTAPGDDGAVGTASLYDIRYSTSPIVTAGDFSAALLVSGEPAPAVAGTSQNMTVTGLGANTLYYFAMKTQDEMPNSSAVSNAPSLSTVAAADTVAPSAVADLALSGPTTTSMVLTWTAPGDDGTTGTATLYDIRYATTAIVSDANFSAASPVSGEPSPTVAGTSQNMTVTGLSPGTLYYFAMKNRDEAPNISVVSNAPSLATVALQGARLGTINVVKRVINDNGGTKTLADFQLFVNEAPVVSGVSNGFPAPAGAYAVTETGDSGYAKTFSGDCDAAGRMNINPGDIRFCILTNDDIGAAVAVPPVPPIITVVKVPSPLDLPNGPGQVTYAYTLRNLGTVPVTDITMVEDACAPVTFISGDGDGDAELDVNETWTYRCAATLTETHTNSILATGWANGLTATDLASATVVVSLPIVPPLIHLTKLPSPLTLPAGGGEVAYTAKITNPGKVALSDVRLTDDTCSPMVFVSGDTDGDSKLDTSETWTYVCRAYVTKTTTATADASGEANGLTVRDFSITTVVVATPSDGKINVIKRVINDNGGTKTLADFQLFVNDQRVVSGVTNTFPAPGAYAVTETDDAAYARTFSGDCGTRGRLTLNPGDSVLCIVTNDDIGAPAAVPLVPQVPAPPPLIEVVKVPAPLTLPDGPGPVTYTYTLRNLGMVPVTDITMVGDACSPIVRVSGDLDGDDQLDVSETWVHTCSTTLSETHTNSVTVTGWANGLTATDIANATVIVGSSIVPPLIHVTSIPRPLTLPAEGGWVTYNSKITNLGTEALSAVSYTDSACAPEQYAYGDTNDDAKLDVDETWTYTCLRYVTETTLGTARADGEANGMVARDYALATVVVAEGATVLFILTVWGVIAVGTLGLGLLLYGILKK